MNIGLDFNQLYVECGHYQMDQIFQLQLGKLPNEWSKIWLLVEKMQRLKACRKPRALN